MQREGVIPKSPLTFNKVQNKDSFLEGLGGFLTLIYFHMQYDN